MPKVNVLFQKLVDYTTGIYVLDAFRELECEVVYNVPPYYTPGCDFYFRVDDGTHILGTPPSPSAFWAIDTVAMDGRAEAVGKCHDRVYEINHHLLHQHTPQATWLPLAASHAMHYAPITESKDYGFALVGSPSPDRDRMVDEIVKLMEKKVKSGDLNKFIYYYGRGKKEEIAKVYSESVCCLNITRFDTLNMRTYEAPMAGTCLLQQKVNGDESGFKYLFPEAYTYRWETVEEAAEIISRLMSNPEEAYTSALHVQKYVKKHHTYTARMKKVLQDFSLI